MHRHMRTMHSLRIDKHSSYLSGHSANPLGKYVAEAVFLFPPRHFYYKKDFTFKLNKIT